jgi:hypothetical protein
MIHLGVNVFMAFGTITTNGKTFNSIGTGLYQLSTVVFGAASNLFKITGGKKANAKAPVGATISRHLEKDIVEGAVTLRKKASVVLQVTVPSGFTTAEIDGMVTDIDLWVSTANLDRLLMGES